MSGITPPKGIDSSRGTDSVQQPGGGREGPTRGADQADADRLARLLRGDRSGDGHGGGGGFSEEQEKPPTDTPLSSAEAILASLGGFQPPPAVEAPPSTEASSPIRGPELNDLADKITERVLTGTRTDGEAEVKIKLNTEMFGETEVSLAKHQGTLEIRIDTMSEDMQKLMQDNAADFATDLARRLDMPVALEVNAASQTDQMYRQGDDDSRRSRGYEQILRYVAESRS